MFLYINKKNFLVSFRLFSTALVVDFMSKTYTVIRYLSDAGTVVGQRGANRSKRAPTSIGEPIWTRNGGLLRHFLGGFQGAIYFTIM